MKRYEDLDAELRRVLDEVRQQMTTTVISYPERNPRDRVWGQITTRETAAEK